MPSGAALLIAWILTFAAWLFVHVVASVRTLRTKTVAPPRWLVWIPPATPVLAWRGGERVLSVLWTAFAVLYIVLRAMG